MIQKNSTSHEACIILNHSPRQLWHCDSVWGGLEGGSHKWTPQDLPSISHMDYKRLHISNFCWLSNIVRIWRKCRLFQLDWNIIRDLKQIQFCLHALSFIECFLHTFLYDNLTAFNKNPVWFKQSITHKYYKNWPVRIFVHFSPEKKNTKIAQIPWLHSIGRKKNCSVSQLFWIFKINHFCQSCWQRDGMCLDW